MAGKTESSQPSQADSDQALSVPEAAQFLKASRSTVNRKIATGELASFKVGALRRILRSDLHAYIQNQR